MDLVGQQQFDISNLWPLIYAVVIILASLVAILVLYRRYQSRRQLVARVAELEALSKAGRAIVAAQLDVTALCHLIAQEAGLVVDNRTFQIGLFEGSLYEILYWTINGQARPTPQTFDLSDNGGVVGWVQRTGRPLLVRDFAREMESLPAQPRYISDTPPRSAVFLPLISGREVIGILAAQSSEPNRFGQRDLRHLTILSNQAAAAIANAQLYEREKTRAAHLELVGQIARQVNAINDLEELFNQVVLLTRETFGFILVSIFSIDPQSGDALVQASSLPELVPGSLRVQSGQGLIGTAVAGRETTLSNNTRDDERFLNDWVSRSTRSEIAIPLIVDDELLGVLDVHSEVVGAFGEQEQMVLEALAAQAAIAIHKTQQFAIQREQAWSTTAQLQMAEAIGHSADLAELSETVVRLTSLLLGLDQCALLLWDEELASYQAGAVYGVPSAAAGRFETLRLAIGDWTALDAVHVGQEKLQTPQRVPWLTDAGSERRPAECSTTTLVPLLSKGQMLGVLVATIEEAAGQEQEQPAVVTDSLITFRDHMRAELLQNFANQAAQAIESYRLQMAQQEEAWVNTALLQVAEAVNKSTDLDEILYTIVRMIPMLVGVKSSLVLFWDEELQNYRAGPSYGLSEMGHGLLESFEIDLAEFPLVEAQDMERVGPEASYYTLHLPPWMHTILETETADTFPLNARGQRVGALVVGPSVNGRPLTGRRLNIVTGIAQQAAIAVVNDQLYQESAERSRMEQELEVARSIQASLIPDGNPDIPGCSVASFWQAARQVSGDFYDFMPLANGKWGIAIADVADKGVPAALFMALSRTILRTVAFNRQNPAEVLERTNQILYNDTTSDLFVTIFYAVWDPANQTLTYANGGHNPPLLIEAGGTTAMLEARGIALGVLENIRLNQQRTKLKPGDTVVFFTDGVTEAINEDYDEFGLERLCLAVSNSRHRDAPAIAQAITGAITDHAGETPQFDDITLIVMKHNGKEEGVTE
jgi:phosphoserine phosphatase RsbU/P